MDEEQARIHSTNPFSTPAESRTPARRVRGHLAAGVTIWTAGDPSSRAGLTVSSVMVAEGEPSRIVGLISDTTDLYETMTASGGFVVHLLGSGQRRLAERFAGTFPSPGGLFLDLQIEDTSWGPALVSLPERVYCRVASTTAAGYHQLVTGSIERIDLTELDDPLVHFRGTYRALNLKE